MYELLKKLERYFRLMQKEFTGPRSNKVWETLLYSIFSRKFSFGFRLWK